MLKQNKIYFFLLFGLILVFIYSISSFFLNSQKIYDEFNQNLNKKESQVNNVLNRLLENDSNQFFYQEKELVQLNKNQGISFYVFKNNDLTSWTNSTAPFNGIDDFVSLNGIVLLKNGWYQYIKKQKNDLTYLGLILIKHQYSIQNKHVDSKLHKSFGLNNEVEISTHQKTDFQNINNNKGSFIFSLKIMNTNYESTSGLFMLAFFMGLIFLVVFVYQFCKQHKKWKKHAALISIFFALLIYIISIWINIPKQFYFQKIFNPSIFGQSSLLPSLGHFLFTTLLVMIITILLTKQVKNNKTHVLWKALFSIVGVSFLNIVFTNWFAGLITNSNISFDINYLLELSAYSFVGILIVMILFTSLVVLIKMILTDYTTQQLTKHQLISLFWIVSLTFILVAHLVFETDWQISSWILFALLIFAIDNSTKTKIYQSALLLVLVALTITVGFVKYTSKKESLNQEFIIKKLAKEADPVSEYLFLNLIEKIKNDTFIVNNIANYWDKKEETDAYLVDKYFSGYWSKYDVFPFMCSIEDTLVVQPENTEVSCIEFFNAKIEQEATSVFGFNENIRFLYNEDGVGSYLGIINIQNNDSTIGNVSLFIEMLPKLLSNNEGYPELLLNEKEIGIPANMSKYSYAKYKKGKLVNNFGDYNFSLELEKGLHFNNAGFLILHKSNQHQLYFQSDKNTTVILSSMHKTIFDYLTTFSYYFICFSILSFILGLIFKIEPFNWRIALSDFSAKIQVFIVVSTFLSFVLFGLGTSYYIEKQNVEQNTKNLKEKLQSVVAELINIFGNKDTFEGVNPNFITNFLIKYSNVFYVDINLYDTSGKLIATSRPEIIESGLISNRINPHAYQSLIFHKKTSFIHDESIGNMDYLSAYVPFRNDDNKVIAYLNLPYFAKQNQLEKELSKFFTALINIYALLFLVSIAIAVVFANYISEPLRLIKEKIGALQLGKSNEFIEWQSNDEIGSLVKEYNKKVLDLEKSAKLLAKSERESAWREMAKQVAHEIKNPLTPMKLSIQHLERSVEKDSTDLPERIKRTAKTLVEQIDTLTHIANEFSNFAKMPKTFEQQLNLIEVLENVIDLYKNEQVEITFENKCSKEAILFADKDQLNRLFSNLIKNAIQAFSDNKLGKIDIATSCNKNNYTITITDNGIGIPDDIKDKIFTPNFTTKSTGMGLGLAMVKNIVDTLNGTIEFTTSNKGTTFKIDLPASA